jgi:hypothetical protein
MRTAFYARLVRTLKIKLTNKLTDNSLVAEPAGSMLTTPIPATDHDPEPTPSICQSQPTYLRSILIFSSHFLFGLPSGHFPEGLPTNIMYASLASQISLHVLCYNTYNSRSSLLCLIQNSPTYFTPPRSKYLPSQPVFKHLWSMIFLQRKRPCFTAIQDSRQNYCFIYIMILNVLHSKRDDNSFRIE